MHWTVDALEDDVARIETDDGDALTVPRTLLPSGVRAGDVVRVTHERTRTRATLEIERDAAETSARRTRSVEQLAEADSLTKGTGDIAL